MSKFYVWPDGHWSRSIDSTRSDDFVLVELDENDFESEADLEAHLESIEA